MKTTVLCHPSFVQEGRILRDGMVVVQNGRIREIRDSFDGVLAERLAKEGAEILDLTGLWLYPSWVDSHLHIPGDLLFQKFGVELSGCGSQEQYVERLEEYKRSHGQTDSFNEEVWIRGFGWSPVIFSENGYETFHKALEERFAEGPVILFSDDYHSCICNNTALTEIRRAGIKVTPDEWGVLQEKDIFLLTQGLPQMCFSEREMEQAILQYQDMLLSLGITAVQTLMFLGGNGTREWQVLKRLDEAGKLKLKVNLALTVQPYEDLGETEARFVRMKTFESRHIRLHTVKLYMDGVVENQTAHLLSPYEGKDDRGRCFWEPDVLADLCTTVDAHGWQIHIHAIGDGAVWDAVNGLTKAMDRNNSKGQNRHVITHMQLAEDSDVRRMAEYGIIGAIQPYWFPQDQEYYGLEIPCLGNRAQYEYKAASMEKMGVMVTGSSDSPVTGRPDPLMGIAMAVFRFRKEERMTVESMRKAFSENGAYQLFREQEIGRLASGFSADLIGLSGQLTEDGLKDGSQKVELRFVMADGDVLSGASAGCRKQGKV